MQQPLRRTITATLLSRAWRDLPAESTSLLPRRGSALVSRAPPPSLRAAAPPSSICRRCRQARGYSTLNSSTTATSAAKLQAAEGEHASAGESPRPKKTSEPLRILFCGSDSFSCASLEALYKEHEQNPELIESIDVVVRPGKHVGRGLKKIAHPPLRELAEKLGLPIHELDTFTGWNMPPRTNLIIAVSFGLFVPPRLLRLASYGGLNLHPSQLPELRGPAPLQHALLANHSSAGISLQTLDPQSFDRGLVLARSPPLPIAASDTFGDLLARITPVAAEMMVRGLREGVHVPPLEAVGREEMDGKGGEEEELIYAPKITKADCQIRATHLPNLWHRYRALGPLWFLSRSRDKDEVKRIIVPRVAFPAPRAEEGGPEVATTTSPAATATAPPPLVSLKKGEEDLFDMSTLAPVSDVIGVPCVPALIPFEEESASTEPASTSTSTSTTPSTTSASTVTTTADHERKNHIVVHFPEDRSSTECYIGGHRIDALKVEGQREMPARKALADFVLLAHTAVAWEE